MYNLIIVGNADTLADGVIVLPRDRFAEHTDDGLRRRFKEINEVAQNELCSIPALFCAEGQGVPTRFGFIRKLSLRPGDIRIEYDVDSCYELKGDMSPDCFHLLDIDKWEFSRTHWSIKDVDLVQMLKRCDLADDDQALQPRFQKQIGKSVFIVHGRDYETKSLVIDALIKLNLNTVVLDEQANAGRSIFDKIKAYSGVDYAVVIYTPCDYGRLGRARSLNARARQNVIFEHGLFVGKLGSDKVMLLVKPHDKWELPSDVQGIGYALIDK